MYHGTDKQFAAMAGAFAAGEADFTTAFEPTATQLEKDGSGYIVASIGKEYLTLLILQQNLI